MKYSKIMRERIHRVKSLFNELGYALQENDPDEISYSAVFESSRGFMGTFYIDTDNKFLETAFNFTLSRGFFRLFEKNFDEILSLCYEYGCYFNLQHSETEISFSLFSKLYFAGLNYYSLKETLKDFSACTTGIKKLIAVQR